MTENGIVDILFEVCLDVHRELGPGLFESVYETVIADELIQRGLDVKRQVVLPVVWKGRVLSEGYRADLILNNKVLVELKSVEKVAPIHKKQLLTYLRLSGCKLGVLVNFSCELLKDGFSRVINGKIE